MFAKKNICEKDNADNDNIDSFNKSVATQFFTYFYVKPVN